MIIIDFNKVSFKKKSGKEKLRCPECDSRRTDKNDKSLLYDHNNGYGKCFYCEALLFNPENDKSNKRSNIEYKRPKQEININYSNKLIKWLESRKISQETARALYVTEEMYYQPSLKAEVNNICFNYYKEHKLVNKKFRSADKKFTQIAGAEVIFYNLNACIGADEVIILEGEGEVMALYECGIKNCISVPNGANNNDDYWINSESYIKDIKSFIIATDNDEKGIKLRDDIVQRLGKYRCKYVEWDKKDANDDLIAFGKEHVIQKIKTAKIFPAIGVLTSEDLRDEVFKLYRDGLPKTIKPLQKRWDDVNKIFSTMMGQLTVVTGIPSHGKSSVIDDYVISLVNDLNLKASWFSPEHNPKGIHQSSFARKVIGKKFWGEGRMTEDELDKYIKWANEKLYITTQDDDIPTWDWLFDRMKEQVLIYGINIFVIDAFNKVILSKGGKEEIDLVLTKLTSFCIRHNVQIFLIVHPTKMRKNEKTGKYEIPTLYDCSGSSDFRNQTHNGITIYREFPEVGVTTGYTVFINTKTKFDFQGEINGVANLFYCNDNSRFYSDENLPLYSYINYESKLEIDIESGDIKEETVFNKDVFKEHNINGLDNFEYIEPNF